MRTYDFAPLWRSSVGFDRLFDLINDTQRLDAQDSYPPYDIVRTGEDTYRISLAVAGFKPEQVNVTMHQNTLTISGQVNQKQDQAEYVYRGIAARPFARRFSLADFVEVKQASIEDGLLQIELERKVPESMKPRKIDITLGNAQTNTNNVKTIGHAKVG